MKINLISFATTTWPKAIKRFNDNVSLIQKNFNFFNTARILTEKDLDDEYMSVFKDYVSDHGYAMWTWKPYIIKKELEKLENNECLIYLDGGSNLHVNDINRTYNYLFLILQYAFLLHSYKFKFGIGLNYNHPIWNKNIIVQVRKDILQYFNLLDNKDFLFNWPHFESGAFMIIKNESIVKFINDWYISMKDNFISSFHNKFHDLDGQYPQFEVNNADQSTLQCLLYSQHKDEFMNMKNFWYDTRIYARMKG